MSSEMCKFDKKLCRCCHAEGEFQSIYSPQAMDIIKEKKMFLFIASVVHADKLRECYNIELLPVREPYERITSAICDGCIQKLHDAHSFKLQVQKCEEEFRKQYYQHVGRDFDVKVNIKEEKSDCKVSNDDHGATSDDAVHGTASDGQAMSHQVKVEVDWMNGPKASDDNDDDDDGDGDRLVIAPEVHIAETKCKKEVLIKPAPKNKRKRKASTPKKPAPPTPTVKRKVGRPKIVAPPKEEEVFDTPEDDVVTKERTLFLLQKDVDYKQVDDQVQCTRCEIKLKNIQCLRVHVKYIHFKMPRYACSVCSKVFQTLNLRNEHKRTEHNMDPKLKCKVCDKRFNQVCNLNRHVRNMHSPADIATKKSLMRKRNRAPPKDKVPDVVKLVKRPAPFKLQENIDYKIVDDVVHCMRCERTATSVDTIRYHLKFKHLNFARFTCPVCPDTFMNSSSYTKHKFEVHNIDHRSKCNACNAAFNTSHQLKHHINGYHMLGEKFKCAECDYEGYSRHHLSKHMMKHNTVKNFHCRYCQKSFVRKSNLSFHERIHTGDKRKVCKECGEAFVQKASLNYHMAKYHPGVDF